MSDWLLENLEGELKETGKKIKEAEREVEHLGEQIRLNKNLSEAEDYKSKISEEDLENLKYETAALEEIRCWEQSKLDEAQQDKRLLEHKISYRKQQER